MDLTIIGVSIHLIDQSAPVYQEYVEISSKDMVLRNVLLPAVYQKFVNEYIKKIVENKKILVLSLRRCSHIIARRREANIVEWITFFAPLDMSEFQPVIVSGTDKDYDELPEVKRYPHASTVAGDMLLRAALYQQAYANFFTPNGTAALAWCCLANSIISNIVDNSSIPLTSERSAKENFGVEVGGRPPVKPLKFRWYWVDDK